MSKIKLLLFILLGLLIINYGWNSYKSNDQNNNHKKINLNKEIDLYALSQKYPKCTNSNYRDECYALHRGNGYSSEGYWREDKLWDGIHKNTELNEIEFKYFDGTQVYVGSGCSMNFSGWYVCRGGDKYKDVNGGTFTKDMKRQGQFIYKYSNGDVFEGNYENGVKHGYGKMTWSNGDVYEGNWQNDDLHGYGKYTWASGKVYKGNWKNGEMVD